MINLTFGMNQIEAFLGKIFIRYSSEIQIIVKNELMH